jgi:chromosome segregation ATPase
MATAKPKTSGPASSGNVSPSIESQLREEIKQLTAALDETDQALDEWVAECEKLQKVVKGKENELKSVGQQMEELKQHAFKLEEERNQLRTSSSHQGRGGSAVASKASAAAGSSSGDLDELRRSNEVLKEQLAQSQKWVKEGLAKLEQANAAVTAEKKRTSHMESEKDAVMKGKKTTMEQERDNAVGEAARLSAVVQAHELELASLRKKLTAATEDARDAQILAGKVQAISTVVKFQAECASTENDAMVDWLKTAVRWSSRL